MKVCEAVDHDLIEGNQIQVEMEDLRQIYIQSLASTKHANSNYRREKLKKKLMKCEKNANKLSFISTGLYKSQFVYNASGDIDEIVSRAYSLGSMDIMTEVGLTLRKCIQDAHKNSAEMPMATN